MAERSQHADLVLMGFTPERLEEKGIELLQRHPALNEVLFVSAQRQLIID